MVDWASDRVVDPPDGVEDIGSRVIVGGIDLFADPLCFERGGQTLPVNANIVGPAHGAGYAVISHQPLERLAGVLAALVGMMRQSIRPSVATFQAKGYAT
jgi:hypothetical protein